MFAHEHVGEPGYSFTVKITMSMVHILLIHSSHFYCFSMFLLGTEYLEMLSVGMY